MVGWSVLVVQLAFQNVRIFFHVPLGPVGDKELSVDCLKPPDSVHKSKQTNKQKKGIFWPLAPLGCSWKLLFGMGGMAIKGSFGFGESPSSLMQTWNNEIHGDENSFQREEDGNSECPFSQMK